MPYHIGFVHGLRLEPGRRVALIPVDLGAFGGFQQFRALWSDGSPAGPIFAAAPQLSTARANTTPHGELCEREAIYLERLREFARERGIELPDIRPTTERPGWAQHDA